MVEELTRSRLGRGIAALIGDIGDETEPSFEAGRAAKRVPIEFIRRNPRNPRRAFDEPELAELAASIKERGLIQPIVVRPLQGLPDAFEIIAGERRWRAAQRAGLHDVPVVVFDADDKLALEMAIIENVQRADLNALEEAAGYEQLISAYEYTQADLAATLGKSRSHIANTMRLLKLPEKTRDMLARKEISAGHARALLSVEDPDAVADRIVARGLTVRDVERLVRGADEPDAEEAAMPLPARRRGAENGADADTRAVEAALQAALGLVVRIDHKGSAGEIRIKYRSLEQLDTVCAALQASAVQGRRPASHRQKRA